MRCFVNKEDFEKFMNMKELKICFANIQDMYLTRENGEFTGFAINVVYLVHFGEVIYGIEQVYKFPYKFPTHIHQYAEKIGFGKTNDKLYFRVICDVGSNIDISKETLDEVLKTIKNFFNDKDIEVFITYDRCGRM